MSEPKKPKLCSETDEGDDKIRVNRVTWNVPPLPELSAVEIEQLKTKLKLNAEDNDVITVCSNAATDLMMAYSWKEYRNKFKKLYECMQLCIPENKTHLFHLAFHVLKTIEAAYYHVFSQTLPDRRFRKLILTCMAWYAKNFEEFFKFLGTKDSRISAGRGIMTLLDNVSSLGVKILKEERTRHYVQPNLVEWSWENIPDSLSSFWPKFTFEGMSNPTSIYITLSETTEIRHSTSVDNLINMITEIKNTNQLKLKGREKDIRSQYCDPLVWCGIKIPEFDVERLSKIGKSVNVSELNGSKPNRYGTVTITFPLTSVLLGREQGVIIGTRHYIKEYSQTILIPKKIRGMELEDFYLIEGCGIKQLELIKLENYKWELSFDCDNWTHSEVAFEEELDIPLENAAITFNDHLCIKYKRDNCKDCNGKANIIFKDQAIERFKSKLVEHGLKEKALKLLPSLEAVFVS